MFVLVLVTTTLSFYKNTFHIANKEWFNHFQKDTEASVIGKVLSDKYGLDTQGYGMVYPSQDSNPTYGNLDIYTMLKDNIKPQSMFIYRSSIGLQGYISSFVYHYFRLSDIVILNALVAFLAAFVVIIVSVLLGKIFGVMFGIVFFISLFFSPWVVCYGNNLYHCIFMWFVPAVFSFLLFLHIRSGLESKIYPNLDSASNTAVVGGGGILEPKNSQNKTYNNHNSKIKNNAYIIFLLSCYCVAIFMRCLCSYEYLTSIILFSLSVFFVAFLLSFVKAQTLSPQMKYIIFPLIPCKVAVRYIVILFVLGVFGFVLAFALHTYIRGNGDMLQGLKDIYQQDFLRRMIGGDSKNFDPAFAKSIESSVIDVVWQYFKYPSLTAFLPSNRAVFLLFICIDIVLIRYVITAKSLKILCSVMLICFALPALSWYVFGKAHSFIHTHMNYILWSFGFVATLFYIPVVAFFQRMATSKSSDK
ncbi:Uncharacterised protein [Helicobacter fennelliae]|uniref:Uncharacterized protein n=1 Tax=Helicobacter fennelliae TaxID=215 RepID=A0A2X3DHP7_9HELI|nr:Uncharacterised protein [Helicobacter fennelliae]